MKKVLVLMGIALSFFLVSCSDEPFSANGKFLGSTGNVQLVLPDADVSASVSKGFYVGSSEVTNAVITLTAPGGSVQTQTWSKGGANVFYFTASVTGLYTFGVVETDTSNRVYSTNQQFNFQGGFNYYVTLSLGGNIVVTVGTNGIISSASSVSSSRSSVSSVSSASSSRSSVSSVSSSSSSSSASVPPAGGSTFGIFSETVSNMIVFDTDAKIEIWNGMTIADDTATAGDGTTSWKFTGTGAWMGMGVRVEPNDAYRNLTAFASGSFRFMYKGSKGFKIGLKSGIGTEAFLYAAQLVPYGLQTNNTWCSVSVPISEFTGLDMSQIAQYFMFATDPSFGYAVGDIVNVDNIYFTTNRTTVAGPRVFGLLTETYPNSVTWDTDGKIDIWQGLALSSDTTTVGDGLTSLKIVATGGVTWGGIGMRVEPLTSYKNLSAYVGGSLKFMFKSSKNFTKIGVKDGNGIEAWVTGSTCISTYGMKIDNTWCTVTIPLSAFGTTIDWTKIQQYLMFVADGANYVSGNTWNIDNIYISK